MKKNLAILLITLVGMSAQAQNKPFACQTDVAAGLAWVNGRWITNSFEKPKFILVQAGMVLTADSVAKTLSSVSSFVTCKNNTYLHIECTDMMGGSLFFDPETLKGGISQLYGSINSGAKRDTVTVQIFSCTPF